MNRADACKQTMQIIDLTHAITLDMPVYPGSAQPLLEAGCSIQADGFAEKKDHPVLPRRDPHGCTGPYDRGGKNTRSAADRPLKFIQADGSPVGAVAMFEK